jgi:competence protein ComEC
MTRVHFLNVGHGDCTVIEHNDGNLTMIDINNGEELDDDSTDALLRACSLNWSDYYQRWIRWKSGGSSSRSLLSEAGCDIELTNPIEFLMENYPGRPVFRYVQTHPDFDHMRGIAALEESGIQVVNFWDVSHSRKWNEAKDRETDKPEWEAYERFRSGNHSRVLNLYRNAKGKYWNENELGEPGGNGLYILSPTPEIVREYDEDGSRNELSYVLRYYVAGRNIIFGGDAEQAAWDSIHKHYGEGLKCDVLKASHHGRDSGFHLESVKAMKPTYTIVSVGTKPDTDASNKYRTHSEVVASTRWYGDISLEVGQNGELSWVTSRQRNSRRAA